MSVLSPLRRALSLLHPHSARYEGMILPPKHIRFGGSHFQQDSAFAQSARNEAERLQWHCGLTLDSRVLDIGCGPGRLPIGILNRVGDIQKYHGIDVSMTPVRWCTRHITRKHPTFRFTHINVYNQRYNKTGTSSQTEFRLPVEENAADIIYLYSVFSHLKRDDIAAYLREFRRVLAPAGNIFLTAFVEADVPDETENPADYGDIPWHGPLHCVRFSNTFFKDLLAHHGFAINRQDYGAETDGQSGFFLKQISHLEKQR